MRWKKGNRYEQREDRMVTGLLKDLRPQEKRERERGKERENEEMQRSAPWDAVFHVSKAHCSNCDIWS